MSISRWLPIEAAGLDHGEILRKRLRVLAKQMNVGRVWTALEDQPKNDLDTHQEEVQIGKILVLDNLSRAVAGFMEARRRGDSPTKAEIDALIGALSKLEVAASPEMSIATLETLASTHNASIDKQRAQLHKELTTIFLGPLLERTLRPGSLEQVRNRAEANEDHELLTEVTRLIEDLELIVSDRGEEKFDALEQNLLMNLLMKLVLRFKDLFRTKVANRKKLRGDPYVFETTLYSGLNNFIPIKQSLIFNLWKSCLVGRGLELESHPSSSKKDFIEKKEAEGSEVFNALSAKLFDPPRGVNFIRLGAGPLGKLKNGLSVSDITLEPLLGEEPEPVPVDRLGTITVGLTWLSPYSERVKTFLSLEVSRFDGDLYLQGCPTMPLRDIFKSYDAEQDYILLRGHILKGMWRAFKENHLKEVDPLSVTRPDKAAQEIQKRLGVPTYTGDTYEVGFEKSWQTLAQGQPGLCRRAYDVIETFKESPGHPSLRTHKLSGELDDVFSISINMAYRIIFKKGADNKLIFLDIGTHEVYRS